MKAMLANINDWLQQEAHVVAGYSFLLDDCSCLPVWPEHGAGQINHTPFGFLVTHGTDLTYLDVHTPEGERMLKAWAKIHLPDPFASEVAMPTEYWYG